MKRRIAALFSALTLVGAGCEVRSTNPFDPETPAENQARGSISGTVQAVLALQAGEILEGVPGEGETLVEAAFCDPREGDHAGFEIVLREIAPAAGDEPRVGRALQTPSTGAFTFENVIAGDYTLEILRPGFRVPPPRTVTVSVGEDVELAPLCALNDTPPERPQLGPLPEVVGGDNRPPELSPADPVPQVQILNCDPEVPAAERSYRVRQVPEGFDFDESATTVELGGEAGCAVDLLLTDLNGAAARIPWRVEVVARDGLGNTSEAAVDFVIRDTQAPPAPDALRAVPGADRVLLTWTQPPPAPLDDSAASFLVSYGLSARPEDAGAACPFGRPGDGFDVATFALEGPSPVAAAIPQATLSGLLPGTNVALQVAAVDAAGNLGCFSAPLFARPDEVTFALELEDDRAIAAARLAHHRGALAFARGAGGLRVVDPEGTATDLDGIVANDVAALGRTFLAAGGPAGLHVVTLPADGAAPTAVTTNVGDDLRAVAARPGLAIAGTTTGLRFLPVGAPDNGAPTVDTGGRGDPVVRVLAEGALVFLARADGRVQVAHRANAAVELDAVDDEAFPPTDAIVHGDELWLSYGDEGVRAFDFSACFAETIGCLVERFDVEMPGDGAAAALAPWDDLVLVAVDDAGVLGDVVAALRPVAGGAPRIVGLAFLPTGFNPTHLSPDELGFCAYNTAGRACYRSAVQGLAAPELPLLTGGVVLQATVDVDSAWLLSRSGDEAEVQQQTYGGLTRRAAALPQIAPSTVEPFFPEGAARLYPAPPLGLGAGYATVDSYGRVFLAAEGESGAMTRVDADLPSALIAAAAALGYQGRADLAYLSNALVDLDAGQLVILAQNDEGAGACVPTVLATVELLEADDGSLGVGAVRAVALDNAQRIAALTVEGGVAFVATAPYRLDAVDLDDLSVTNRVAAPRACDAGDAAGFGAFGVQPLATPAGRELLAGGAIDLSGPVLEVRSLLDDAALPLNLDDEAVAIGAARDLLTVALASGGGLVFQVPADRASVTQLIPSFALPSLRDVQSLQPTARGILIADGANGALWHPVR